MIMTVDHVLNDIWQCGRGGLRQRMLIYWRC